MVFPSLVIQNAQILLPNDEFMVGEVQTQEGQVLRVGADLSSGDDRITTLDATELTLLPSVVDP